MIHPITALKTWSHTEHRFTRGEILAILAFLFVCSGVFGFVYETFFYRIDLGYFVKRGTTLGPWIPIYGFGGLLILAAAYRIRKRPWAVFLLGTLASGILEFAVGWFLWTQLHLRLWDYNVEIWNWGNINGYICARSVLFFGFSGLFLVYLLTPVAMHLAEVLPYRVYAVLAFVPCALFVADMVISNFL